MELKSREDKKIWKEMKKIKRHLDDSDRIPTQDRVRKDVLKVKEELNKSMIKDKLHKIILLKFSLFLIMLFLIIGFFTSEYFWRSMNIAKMDNDSSKQYLLNACNGRDISDCNISITQDAISLSLDINGYNIKDASFSGCKDSFVRGNEVIFSNCSISSIYNKWGIDVDYTNLESGLTHRTTVNVIKHYEITTLESFFSSTSNRVSGFFSYIDSIKENKNSTG
jgi:hypothetical protein